MLKKSLGRLQKSPGGWQATIHEEKSAEEFRYSMCDPNSGSVCRRFVGDWLICANDHRDKYLLLSRFSTEDLGGVSLILGLQGSRHRITGTLESTS